MLKISHKKMNIKDPIQNKVITKRIMSVEEEENDLYDYIDKHADNINNPHEVTAEQVGLGNVENKSVSEISSAILTQANIISGLGYTPTDSTDVDEAIDKNRTKFAYYRTTEVYDTDGYDSQVVLRGYGDNITLRTESVNGLSDTCYVHWGDILSGTKDADLTNFILLVKFGFDVSGKYLFIDSGYNSNNTFVKQVYYRTADKNTGHTYLGDESDMDLFIREMPSDLITQGKTGIFVYYSDNGEKHPFGSHWELIGTF